MESVDYLVVYQAHPDTGEYVGEVHADKDPLEPDRFLIPGGATIDVPPESVEGLAIVRIGDQWEYVKDMRGTIVYDKQTGEPMEWNELGELPSHLTTVEPEIPEEEPEVAPEPEPEIPEEEPEVAPEPEPEEERVTITMRQCRLMLHRREQLELIDGIIDGLDEPFRTEALIEWEYAATVDRESAIANMLADALGMSEEDCDEFFIQAAAL